MVRVCEGTVSKAEMLEQSINEYKAIYRTTQNEFRKITDVRMAAVLFSFNN